MFKIKFKIMNYYQKIRFLGFLNTVSCPLNGERTITDDVLLKVLETYLDDDKRTLNIKPRYTPNDGKTVVDYVNSYELDCVLVGSLSRGQNSNNDIDILITRKNPFIPEKLKEILKPRNVIKTDFGGLYFEDTIYGDIDIFFSKDDFDY